MAKSKIHISKDNIPAFKMLITMASLAGTLGGWAVIAQSTPPAVADASPVPVAAPGESPSWLGIDLPGLEVRQPQPGLREVKPVQIGLPRISTGSSK